jgi:NAD(P)-dependent dehydrogenase (short-subunit alcohol dehydrogenase family)/acyl carrier protein
VQPAGAAWQAALWGLARVVRLEHPELACACIDIDADVDALDRLAAAMAQTEEPDLVLRGQRVWLPKLVRYKLSSRELTARNLPTLRDDAAYLISGGLGALGLQLAEWLVKRGARHLVLLGRRAPNPAATTRIAALTQQGVQVEVVSVDIADAADLQRALAARQDKPAIAGVFHLAGVLDDGMVQQQNAARFAAVLAPKLEGACNLHRAFLGGLQGQLQGQPLDYFVCFSSVAGLTGSMGQSPYAAANAGLDALMAMRRAVGLAGLSIQWGPWAESGMAAAQSDKERQRFAGYGIEPIQAAAGMTLLGYLMQQTTTAVANTPATLAVMPVQWQTYLAQLYSGQFGGKFPPMYRQLHDESIAQSSAAAAQATAASGLVERLAAATPVQRRELLEQHVRVAIAGVIGLSDAHSIEPRQRLFELGLDSLGAVELRNRLAVAMGRTLRATLIFDYPTLVALADHLEHDVLGYATAVEEAAPAAVVEDLDAFSDDELARMLAAELGV